MGVLDLGQYPAEKAPPPAREPSRMVARNPVPA